MHGMSIKVMCTNICFGSSKSKEGDRSCPQNVVGYILIHTVHEVYKRQSNSAAPWNLLSLYVKRKITIQKIFHTSRILL